MVGKWGIGKDHYLVSDGWKNSVVVVWSKGGVDLWKILYVTVGTL